MQKQFRLDDLLARDVSAQWFEGVAIVQLICRQLRAHGRDAGFPRPADILVGHGGSVSIAGESTGDPVPAAAHLLALMLSDDVPVRLRLAVSQATTSGGYASLAEFSAALAYFERPYPESIVEAFRERAMSASPRAISQAPRIEMPAAIEKQQAPTPFAPRRGVNRLAVVATVGAAVACGAIWLIGRSVTHVAAPEVAIAEHAARVVPVRAEPVNGAANRTAGRPRKAVHAAPGSAERAAAVRWPAAEVPMLQVTAASASYSYPDEPPIARLLEPIPAATTSAPAMAARAEDTETGSERIYTRADPEVTLPFNVYPRFSSQQPTGADPARTVLELTIATDGLVERVRMLTVPRNIHEFMLLSAAKAWRFEPARVSGRPVRFRQTISFAGAR